MKNTIFRVIAIMLVLSAMSCSTDVSDVSDVSIPTDVPEILSGLEDLSFDDFLNQSYMTLIRQYPELITELGLDSNFGLPGTELNSYSEEWYVRQEALERGIFEILQSYEPAELSPDREISHAVYSAYLEDIIEGHQFRRHSYLVSYMITSVNYSTQMFFTDIQPVGNLQEAENYITRLRLVKRKMSEVVDQIARQENEGIRMAKPLIGPTLNSLRQVTGSNVFRSPFYTAFRNKLYSLNLPDEEEQRLLGEAAEAVRDSVIPGYEMLESAIERQRAGAQGATGVSILPEGRQYYAWTLRHHSNSDKTPEEIHDLGVAELDRIHREMRELFNSMGFDPGDSISTLYNQLNREARIIPATRMAETHRELIDEAVAWMEPYFEDFPLVRVEVKEDTQGGFYVPPSFDGKRPGVFYATNQSAPYYTLPTLTFHETYPGHHYQIALNGEMDLPFFRKMAWFTGFLEGWALYSEWLMAETGFYADDPEGALGHLQAEAFRAARLVVDTGLHNLGWSIDEATAYFEENTGFSRGFAQGQIYRYLVWPGQAVSYYIGYLEFRDLAERERERLGENFDYSELHQTFLMNGPMPLTLLKELVFGI